MTLHFYDIKWTKEEHSCSSSLRHREPSLTQTFYQKTTSKFCCGIQYDNEHPPNWRLDCQFWKEKYWLPSLSKIDLKKLPNVDDLDVKDFETSPY